MAKVGYIFLAEGYDTYEADIQWMKEYGCVRIIEEKTANERLRPDWRQLLMTLERGDVLVLTPFVEFVNFLSFWSYAVSRLSASSASATK